MIQTSVNLPTKRRLDITLVRRRNDLDNDPLLPDLGKILRVRKGSRVSRFFRHIFEHKKTKKLLGTNLAAIIIASSILPNSAILANNDDQVSLAGSTQTPLTTQNGVQYPLKSVKISQGYKFYHPGIDLDGITGDAIYPIMAGRVEAVQYSKYAYGNAVLINHGNEITSLYSHLSKILVANKQDVDINTVLGEVGATGRASGDHLHLEIRDHNYPISPFSVLP